MAERTVLGTRGDSSMVKVKWADIAPQGLYEVEEAEELGAVWEGEELVVYDFEGFCQLYEYYQSNEYLPDND
jgi:hypothetical protein